MSAMGGEDWGCGSGEGCGDSQPEELRGLEAGGALQLCGSACVMFVGDGRAQPSSAARGSPVQRRSKCDTHSKIN